MQASFLSVSERFNLSRASRHELVDKLSVGGGLRLLDDRGELKKLSLKHVYITDNGIIVLEYQPK